MRQGKYVRGTQHPKSKFTEQQVQRLRRLYYEECRSIGSISRSEGIPMTTLCKIIRYDTWRHVPDDFINRRGQGGA